MSSPTHPVRSDARANRQRILTAADRVYAQEGVDVTLDRIAHAAGVGVGTVYRNFGNKSELVEAVLAERVDGLLDLARSCAADDDARDGLFRLLRTVGGMIRDSVALGQLLDGRSEQRDRLLRVRAQLMPLLEQLIARAQSERTIRPDFTTADLPMIFTMLRAVQQRTSGLEPSQLERWLDILLQAIALPEAEAARPALSEEQVQMMLGGRS